MRKFLVLTTVLCLWGCEEGINDVQTPANEANEAVMNLTDKATLKGIKAAAKGEMCGGIAGIMCGAGLECQIAADHADASGICVESVEQKDLICPKERQPVCGIKNGAKNGYLNECEAVRHGAKVVSEGFCKADESVAGNCEADFVPIGNCADDLSGFVYHADKKACTKKYAKGCEAEIPFVSLEDCQATCIE